jgi:hypothetical protein
MTDRFVITKCEDGWLIAVDGAPMLVCKRKAAAHRAVRVAIAQDIATIVGVCLTEPRQRTDGGPSFSRFRRSWTARNGSRPLQDVAL